MSDLFDTLLQSSYNGYNIYIHNGSSFDLIFLLKYLANIKGVNLTPTYKDGKFLNLKIYYKEGNKKFNLSIKDSMLLLPSSLADLAKSFNLDDDKDIFPYTFPNKNNLDYMGPVPAYKYFDNKKVSLEQYNDYVLKIESHELANEGVP